MEPGIYEGLSFAQYLDIPAINKSGLDEIHRSPAHFLARYGPSAVRKKDTPAKKLGSAIHTAILEPQLFDARYLVEPEDPPNKPTSRQINAKKPSPDTVLAIKFWDDFNRAAAGRIALSSDDYAVCLEIGKRIRQNAGAQEFLTGGKSEVTVVWMDPVENVLCKARIDYLTDNYIVDLKSAESASWDDFNRSAVKYKYPKQNAWYADGMKTLTGVDRLFVFAAFEKEEPFGCGFFRYDEPDIEVARQMNRLTLKKYAQCLRDAQWPGYTDELQTLKLPAWFTKTAKQQPIGKY